MDLLTRRQLIQYSAIMGGALARANFVSPRTTLEDPALRPLCQTGVGPMIASTPVDSSVFAGIFSTDAMRMCSRTTTGFQKYLNVEAALARVPGRLGIIPREAADEIQRNASADKFDIGKLKTRTELVGYPAQPVVEQLVSLCAGKLGEYCLWGATTQDITDPATVLQIREALQ